MCSTVCTFTEPSARVVARSTVWTLSTSASMNGWSSRSTRLNLNPYPAGAGFRVRVTLAPVWREVPSSVALEATVWEPLLRRIGFRLTMGYEQWPVVEQALQQAGVTGLETQFTDDVTATGRIVDSAFAALEQHLTNLCRGCIRITTSD